MSGNEESASGPDLYDPIVCATDVDIAALCDDVSVMPLLRDEGRPVFNDSWEAEALAIVRALVTQGVFTAREWYDVISEVIAQAQLRGDPDRGDTYYQHWMLALERITMNHGLIDADTLAEHQRLWARAVANTPHGTPIVFENAFAAAVDHDHDHGAAVEAPEPMAVYARGSE